VSNWDSRSENGSQLDNKKKFVQVIGIGESFVYNLGQDWKDGIGLFYFAAGLIRQSKERYSQTRGAVGFRIY